MITPTICQVAVGMAGTSLVLQPHPRWAAVAVPLMRPPRSGGLPQRHQSRRPNRCRHQLWCGRWQAGLSLPSLKLTAQELRAHARSLGVRNAHWRNAAKKVDLVVAIREHYKQQEASSGPFRKLDTGDGVTIDRELALRPRATC